MNERVEQNITECDIEDGFDWEHISICAILLIIGNVKNNT